MKKTYFLLFIAIACFAGKSNAQVVHPCGTDEMHKQFKENNPQIALYEKQLNESIQTYISSQSNRVNHLGKKTESVHNDTDYYDIPVVVHIMHNYGPELVTDNKVYSLITEMNNFYSLNYNYSAVITRFKKYVGNAKFRFHLATKDPNGNPTKGITHEMTYLTYGGDEQAKMGQWPPTSYVNIWFESVIGRATPGGIVAAYAVFPSTAAANPYTDGIIGNYNFINDGSSTGGGTIDHEMGHILNLAHTFGASSAVDDNKSGSCTDDDGVDDTPPTSGNFGGCSLYDSVCATNYFKVYPSSVPGIDSLENYPDTANEQNIMNYADCKIMLTKGQVWRMRATLNSDIGGRNNLWDSANLVYTGALAPLPDMKPIPDFVINPTSGNTDRSNYRERLLFFTFPNSTVKFVNTSWRDTVQSIDWTFTHGPTNPSSNNTASVNNAFSEPGWVPLTMKVTGNNSGDTTVTWDHALFVSDINATSPTNYYQEFTGGDVDKWPMFNYYNNGFKWKLNTSVGYYDNFSIQYQGYDTRLDPSIFAYPRTGSPKGDFDDFFSVPFDLTSFGGGNCNMNFFMSAASRSTLSLSINDTLEIAYATKTSTGAMSAWTTIGRIGKSDLINKGVVPGEYTPQFMSDWKEKSVVIPTGARTGYTVFRYRYRPGVGADGIYSSGNNLFLDRINFSTFPANVANVKMDDKTVLVVPNPTNGDAYVVLKDVNSNSANIVVTDITGKVVYTASEAISGNEARILIPATAIAVKGIYMVQTVTGSQVNTQKLVTY